MDELFSTCFDFLECNNYIDNETLQIYKDCIRICSIGNDDVLILDAKHDMMASCIVEKINSSQEMDKQIIWRYIYTMLILPYCDWILRAEEFDSKRIKNVFYDTSISYQKQFIERLYGTICEP